ncbi:MAG: ferredoxin:thioredoxin reductase [Planctomycetes bacterium]|nr:ferredoxin:thioredoxin reductase [Planctomycetota bacterium]
MKNTTPETTEEKPLEQVEREVRERLEEWLTRTPYSFNPEDSVVKTIIRGIAIRKIKAGDEYCPCRVLSGDLREDSKIVCPCVYSKGEIENDGICLCHLFVGPNYKSG